MRNRVITLQYRHWTQLQQQQQQQQQQKHLQLYLRSARRLHKIRWSKKVTHTVSHFHCFNIIYLDRFSKFVHWNLQQSLVSSKFAIIKQKLQPTDFVQHLGVMWQVLFQHTL